MDVENADVNIGFGTPLLTRSRPNMLTEAIAGMSDEQKRVVIEMGFGGLLKLTLKTIPAAFARYVVGLLDTDEMVLDTPKGKIPIDRMAVHEVLGFPLGNRQILRRRVSNYNTELAKQWKSYSKESLELSGISIRIIETTTANRMFQVDFLILMATLMIIAKKNNKINREILITLPPNFVSKEYDWCEYVVHAVRTCKRDWEPSNPNSYFLGPLTFLMLLYCDRVCPMLEPPILRNRPVIAQWKHKDLLRRIEVEISSGAYGSGEFLVEWRKTSEAKEYRSKNIHFEECGCLGLEDDEDVTEVEDGEETTKEDDVNPSFLDTSEAGITHSMTLLDVNDKAEAPFDEPEAPQHNEQEPNAPIDEASTSGGDTMPTGENNDVDQLNLKDICMISSDDEDDYDLGEVPCRRRVQSRELLGKWTGVDENEGDWKVMWPPMVIIRNTQFEQGENGKWLGMGTEELLEYHKSSGAVQACHAFGPEGHKGISVLIFDTSVEGYEKAQLLSKKYERQGIGRDNWNHNPSLFHHSGSRQLYGYLATEQDLKDFNQDLSGKWKLTFELASYEEKIVSQREQWNKDIQQRKERELNDAREERDRLMKLGEKEMRG